MAKLTGLADILHTDGLATHRVVGHRKHHKRHVAFVFDEHFFQFFQADIALEGDFELGVIGLRNGHVDGESLAALDVALRGVKVGIARHHHTRFHQIAEQHVFSSTALVGGDDEFKTGKFRNGVLHIEKRAGAAIALIAHHHRTPLAVAHRAGAGVRQEVDIHIIALQHKNVLVGLFKPFFSFFSGGFLDGFDHLDFPRFCKR